MASVFCSIGECELLAVSEFNYKKSSIRSAKGGGGLERERER